jgi:5S rRNA maturation endonuclease (ribonuclease M5)
LASLQRKVEELTKLLEGLVKVSKEGIPIIVEGKKDEVALRRLGVKGEVLHARLFRGFRAVQEVLKERRAVILTDFDRRGEELNDKLTRQLRSEGVEPDLYYWRRIGALTKRDVKTVEGLPSYLQRVKEKAGLS